MTCLALKEEQKWPLSLPMRGKNVFTWLPLTGYGKSVCYESLLFTFDLKLGQHESQDEHSVVLNNRHGNLHAVI